MPVKLEWYYPEHTIQHYVFTGYWTWEEFYPLFEQGIQMVIEAQHRVDTIVDFTTTNHLPPSALTHLRIIAEKQTSNAGLAIFVTKSAILLSLFKVGVTVYPKIKHYFRMLPTEAEALAIIETTRTNAP
ncbi:MAG: hypothetical protein H7Y11_15695 [Armatimonadetes bacterium]|nr:hypothetical protein [Anaerolineae bacterium]